MIVDNVELERNLPEPIAPTAEKIAINYTAMGDSVKMINDTIAGDTILVEATDKQDCVDINVAQLELMVKRIEILVNRTREDYASRSEVSDQITRLSESMIRLESKLDRVLEKK